MITHHPSSQHHHAAAAAHHAAHLHLQAAHPFENGAIEQGKSHTSDELSATAHRESAK